MKVVIVRVVNDKLNARAAAKEHNIDSKASGKYLENFYQDKYNKIKWNHFSSIESENGRIK